MKIFTPGDDIHWICRESNFFQSHWNFSHSVDGFWKFFMRKKSFIEKSMEKFSIVLEKFLNFLNFSQFFIDFWSTLLFKSDYFSFFHLQSNFINKKFKNFRSLILPRFFTFPWKHRGTKKSQKDEQQRKS